MFHSRLGISRTAEQLLASQEGLLLCGALSWSWHFQANTQHSFRVQLGLLGCHSCTANKNASLPWNRNYFKIFLPQSQAGVSGVPLACVSAWILSLNTSLYSILLIYKHSYTGRFTTLGHNCRRWFPRSLWSKKFI